MREAKSVGALDSKTRYTRTSDIRVERWSMIPQGFRVADPLDFQIPERLDEPITELMGAGIDPDLGHAEAQHDLPVRAPGSRGVASPSTPFGEFRFQRGMAGSSSCFCFKAVDSFWRAGSG